MEREGFWEKVGGLVRCLAFICALEVVKVFGETFLAKRYVAGREDGREEMREERDAEWLNFLEEHPEATVDQLKELLRGGELSRNGAGSRNGK